MQLRAISIFTADLPLAQPFRHASSGLIERLHAVREAVTSHAAAAEAQLATGTNQGWSAKQAIRALRRFEAAA